jgi:hypothetical protein
MNLLSGAQKTMVTNSNNPGEGSWDSKLHDPALQQTQLGIESGFQEAPTTESDELE